MLSVTQLDERIDKCLAILADNPHSQVFAALAEAYRKRGELGRAFAVCKGGLKHHPDYAPAHIVMAKLYLHHGMYDEALESLKRAESADGVTRASELLEVEILIGKRDLDQAKMVIDRLRSTDRANPALKDLLHLWTEAHESAVHTSHSPDSDAPTAVRTAPPEFEGAPQEPPDWGEWAAAIAARPHVSKAFAVTLSDLATTPFSILAEAGHGLPSVDLVSMCTAMFASIDADCRSQGPGLVVGLRVEWSQGELWCHRLDGRVIGFAAERGVSYGAVRQMALDGAARLTKLEMAK